MNATRNAIMLARYQAGERTADIAASYGLSTDAVQRALNKATTAVDYDDGTYTAQHDIDRARFWREESIAERKRAEAAAERQARRLRIDPPDWLAPLERPYGGSPRCVYFIQAVDGGPVKIGSTYVHGVCERLRGIQTGNPHDLVVRCIIEGNYENALHKHFAHLRVRGEWFEADDELNALIVSSDGLGTV